MTDRNLDYDYASKQRVLFNEHYQGYTIEFNRISNLWTADGKTVGADDEGVYFLKTHVNDTAEYDVRDSVPILRCQFYASDNTLYRYLVPDWPVIDFTLPWEFTCLCYMDDTWYGQCSMTIGLNCYRYFTFENEPGYRDVLVGCKWPDPDTQVLRTQSTGSAQLSAVAGWVRVRFAWDPTTEKMSGKLWNDGDAEPDWQAVTENGEETQLFDGGNRAAFTFGIATFSNPANVEIAWMRLEVG